MKLNLISNILAERSLATAPILDGKPLLGNNPDPDKNCYLGNDSVVEHANQWLYAMESRLARVHGLPIGRISMHIAAVDTVLGQ